MTTESTNEQKVGNNNNTPTSQNNSNNLSSSVENNDAMSPNLSTQSATNGSTSHPVTPNGKSRSFTVTELQMNDRMEQNRLKRDGSVQGMGTNILSMGSLRTATMRSSSDLGSKDKKEKKDKKDKK